MLPKGGLKVYLIPWSVATLLPLDFTSLEQLCWYSDGFTLDISHWCDFCLENGCLQRFGKRPTCGDENTTSISYFCFVFLENRLFSEKAFGLMFRPFESNACFQQRMLQQCNFCPVCGSWLKAMRKQQQEPLAHASATHVGCVVVKRERVVYLEFLFALVGTCLDWTT